MIFALLFAVSAGIVAAYLGLLPSVVSDNISNISTGLLLFLLFLVGYGMGRDKESLRTVAKGEMFAFLIPMGTIIGTLIGGFLAGLILDIGVRESVAVSAGFGWYSFSAVYLAKAHSADLGAIAFLSNFMREFYGILFIPLASRLVGIYPAITIGGATTMDVTLPIIARYGGNDAVIVAFVHGVILSIVVPLILPFII